MISILIILNKFVCDIYVKYSKGMRKVILFMKYLRGIF